MNKKINVHKSLTKNYAYQKNTFCEFFLLSSGILHDYDNNKVYINMLFTFVGSVKPRWDRALQTL